MRDSISAKSQQCYDSSNPEHEAFLFDLWKTVFPDVNLKDRRTSQWVLLGFQGRDPATDFRGMGILGLYLLLFFAKNFPQQTRNILGSERTYPFAITGINLAHFICTKMFGIHPGLVKMDSVDYYAWNSPALQFLASVQSSNAFEHMLCHILLLFDSLWVEMKAEYMDFSKVMDVLHSILNSLFQRKPYGMEQFTSWIGQIIVSISSNNQNVCSNKHIPRYEYLSELISKIGEQGNSKRNSQLNPF